MYNIYFPIDIVYTSHVENTYNEGHISLRGAVWAYKASLTPPLFIEVPVSSQKSEWSYIIVLTVSILSSHI